MRRCAGITTSVASGGVAFGTTESIVDSEGIEIGTSVGQHVLEVEAILQQNVLLQHINHCRHFVRLGVRDRIPAHQLVTVLINLMAIKKEAYRLAANWIWAV